MSVYQMLFYWRNTMKWWQSMIASKVELINQRRSPSSIKRLKAIWPAVICICEPPLIKKRLYQGADFVIIATPTDYDTETNYFNTSTVEVRG